MALTGQVFACLLCVLSVLLTAVLPHPVLPSPTGPHATIGVLDTTIKGEHADDPDVQVRIM
jgi:hypothetical protein